MPTYSQRLVGSIRVANKFRGAAAALEDAYPILVGWGQRTRATLKSTPYPSRLPHFKHTRTGNLANRWSVVKDGRRAIMLLNSAHYASYVLGNASGEGQRKHPSFARWWIARKVVDEQIPELKEDILTAIRRKFGG